MMDMNRIGQMHFNYSGVKASQISFPLGGIGSGCIGLSGNGRLIDWEIFNRPNKHSVNAFSHLAIKAEHQGKLVDARVLQGDLLSPYMGECYEPGRTPGVGFGAGPARDTMAGFPHFASLDFRGEFPIADLEFQDTHFPGRTRLRAFNPFIPLNAQDSSLPAAFFEIAVENTSEWELDYTVALTVNNPNPVDGAFNAFARHDWGSDLRLGTTSPLDKGAGDLTVATDAALTSVQEYWFRGDWFDNLVIFWKDFTTAGGLPPRSYARAAAGRQSDHGTLAAHFVVLPGETGRVRFVLAWNFPVFRKYWRPLGTVGGSECCDESDVRSWKNHYATLFADSSATARYALENWQRLHDETLLFKESLFSSTLPVPVIDAIAANISILKTPTVLRLEDGSFYGFEGCRADTGSCEGSCTHVWNYAYALPFLFPTLERSMRNLDYRYNLSPDGDMPFRLQLPLGSGRSGFRPCVDGQLGGVIKVYRDWKISGDNDWLRTLWPSVKKSLEFAWSEKNADRWDPDKSGVISGRQHHTLDVELFGPNSWLTGFYLAALKAAAEMAEFCGEPETAAEYRAIFAKGKVFADRELFNGEYYHQRVDVVDRSLLAPFGDADPYYWNDEHRQIKYQIGEGCGIDQVVAQWHANLCGLGEIFDPGQVRKALSAVYRYNFKPSFREFVNFYRIFALNDEAGTVMFSWPAGKDKPVIAVPYAEETMHGFEYQVAAHMIMNGMETEGCELVKAVRDRYDGEKRNPWAEMECGSNYARSMASYSLLNAFSGFSFDLTKGEIGFDPPGGLRQPLKFFWSLGSAWGTVKISAESICLQVLYGELRLRRLRLPAIYRKSAGMKAALNGLQIASAASRNGAMEFETEIALVKDGWLEIGQRPNEIKEGGQ
jgi:uncharacterized protein (DUF608 family)